MKTIFTLTLYLIIVFVFSSGCNKQIKYENLESGKYYGTFQYESDSFMGSVSLVISDGYYNCSTNLPFNYGAGKIEISDRTLNFIDTLFFAVPAIYLTGYSLSGEYNYQYDGINLKIVRDYGTGKLIYTMKRRE